MKMPRIAVLAATLAMSWGVLCSTAVATAHPFPGQRKVHRVDLGGGTRTDGRYFVRFHNYRKDTYRWKQVGTRTEVVPTPTRVWVPDPNGLSMGDLLNWDGAPVKLDGTPINGHLPISSGDTVGGYDYWEHGGCTASGETPGSGAQFAHNVDLWALNQVLGDPSYLSEVGTYYDYTGTGFIHDYTDVADKGAWIADYDAVSGSGRSAVISTCEAPNTTSSLLEAGRLSQIYELMQAGQSPPSTTLSGWFLAYGDPHPYTIPFTADAILQKIREIFDIGINTDTPICLDLNHDGRIDVTGKSTAAVRIPSHGFVRQGSVRFDLDGFGQKHRYEWLKGSGDGFLVYDKGGILEQAIHHGGVVDGRVLFGNAIGYDNGFQKLAVLTQSPQVASRTLKGLPHVSATAIRGKALDDLKVWIDRNHDARVQPSELYSLKSLGITEIGLVPKLIKNKDGEIRVVSYFVQHGQRHLSEDVFFAEDPADR